MADNAAAAGWTELRLFDLPGQPDVDVDTPGLSETRKRTLRNQALIEAGVHPATRLALRDGATCGSCAHLLVNESRRRRWFKCGLVPVTNGAGSDVRTSWPACVRWMEVEAFRRTEEVPIKGEVL